VIRKYLLPLLALLGAIFAVKTVMAGAAPTPVAAPFADPAVAPFERFVAGAGIVEPSSENVAIGAPVGALVVAVDVAIGQEVAAGAPLFRLDARTLEGERQVAEAAVVVAAAKLARLEQQPRAEDLPPLRARVAEAEAQLADAEDEVARWDAVEDRRAVSADLLARKRFAATTARTRVASAQAELAKAEAGSWAPDLAIARAELDDARARLAAVAIEVERHVVRAPMAGVVLQLKIRAGEFAQAGALAQPLALLGAAGARHVRVDVDEHDAWRVAGGARAVANVRGNRDRKSALEFVRFEPYVVPKRSLTGDSNERVDTRVLQVVYRIADDALPLFFGQQMDVFIEEPKAAGAGR